MSKENMKRYILPALGLLALPLSAQNIVDATRFGSNDIAGTARYRAMGGAFGALGGDPSSMGDNPAGMGIYRGTSAISFTPSLSVARTNAEATFKSKQKARDLSVSNLAYVVSFKTDGDHLVNFNIGIGFNHSEGINRKYQAFLHNVEGINSFGSYLANRGNNTLMYNGAYSTPKFLGEDSSVPLIEYYAYDSYAIDQVKTVDSDGKETLYDGVESIDQHYGDPYTFQRLRVAEKSRNDEYNFNFSGNWDDFIYGGLTMTVNDYSSITESMFDEDIKMDQSGDFVSYDNNLETKGTAFGLKAGVLIKPTDSWRIGFSAHTPTWYRMEDFYNGQMVSAYSVKDLAGNRLVSGGETFSYKYRYQSPWQMQISTAYVIGSKALVSIEADLKDFSTQKYKADRSSWEEDSDFDNVNAAIKDFNKMQMTLKAGAEYRLTDHFSLRAGYSYQSSPYKDEVLDNPALSRGWKNGYYGDDNYILFDSSTKPNHTILGAQQYISGGFGWSGKWWNIDLSFVDRKITEKMAAYPTTDAILNIDGGGAVTLTNDPNYGAVKGNYCDLKTDILSWDLTIGLKF